MVKCTIKEKFKLLTSICSIYLKRNIYFFTKLTCSSFQYCLVMPSCIPSWMTLPSSSIPSHFLAVPLRHPNLFLSFPFRGRALVPQRRLLLPLLHKFGALSRTSTWHSIAWWDKQHFHTSATLSSEWQYFLLLAQVDNWVSFVLLSAVRSYLSPIASDLVIWRWDAWSWPLYPCKGIPLCFYVTNGAIHYVPLELSGQFALKWENALSSCPFRGAAKTLFVSTWNVIECMAYQRTIICPLIIHAFSKLPRLTLYVFDE